MAFFCASPPGCQSGLSATESPAPRAGHDSTTASTAMKTFIGCDSFVHMRSMTLELARPLALRAALEEEKIVVAIGLERGVRHQLRIGESPLLGNGADQFEDFLRLALMRLGARVGRGIN